MGTKAENESARIGARELAVEAMKKLIECERACGASNDEIAQDFASVIFSASNYSIIVNVRLEPDKDIRMKSDGPAVVKRIPDWCR